MQIQRNNNEPSSSATYEIASSLANKVAKDTSYVVGAVRDTFAQLGGWVLGKAQQAIVEIQNSQQTVSRFQVEHEIIEEGNEFVVIPAVREGVPL